MDKFHAVTIDQAQSTLAFLGRNNFHRSSLVQIHRPLGNIKMMSTHITQTAPGVLPVATPLWEVTMDINRAKYLVKTPLGCRSLPHFPIDTIRPLLGRQITSHRRRSNSNLDLVHFANTTVTNALNGPAKVSAKLGTLLAANLKHNVVPSSGLNRLKCRSDGHCQRLFTVNILLRIGSHDGRHGMPMVRRADYHGVDRFVREQLSEIIICLAAMIRAISTLNHVHRVVSTHLGYLGYPNHTAILLAKEKVQVTATHDTNPDKTQIDFAAWLGCPSTGGDDIWRDRCRGERGTQELTTSNIHNIR